MANQNYDEIMNLVTSIRQKAEALEEGRISKGEFAEFEKKVTARIDEIELKAKRPAPAIETTSGRVQTEAKEAYFSWMRNGQLDVEKKTLVVSDNATGGFFAPPEFVNELLQEIQEYSDFRRLARVRTTSNRSVQLPRKTGHITAQWVSEVGTRTDQQGTLAYGLEEVHAPEMSALVDISMQDLEDSQYDIEADLRSEFGEQFGVAEGTAFITGNGVSQPEGILVPSTVTDVEIATTNLTVWTSLPDKLLEMAYGLKGQYARNGSFLMKRSTILKLRLLKDKNDRYLWEPALQVGGPSTFDGKPIEEMPDFAVPAVAGYLAAFGDWKRAYTIVDRVAIATQRDPYTQATSGVVRFTARKRTGGRVMMPEAYQRLKIAS